MSYVKNTWNTGDVITAEKLNHAEEGIEAASNNVLTVGGTYDSSMGKYTLDKTWKQLYDACVAGKMCVLVVTDGFGSFSKGAYVLSDITNSDDSYYVEFKDVYCEADGPNSFPAHWDS